MYPPKLRIGSPLILQVNRSFRDIIDGSSEAQYLIDLYAAGLEVEHEVPSLTLSGRREQLNRYRSHWDSLRCVEHTSLPLPRYLWYTVKGGIICLVLVDDHRDPTADYHLIQLPSALRGIPLKEWTLRGLLSHHSPVLLPEEDLLIICSSIDNRGYSSKEVHGTPC